MSQNFENYNLQNEPIGDTEQNAVPPMGFAPFFSTKDYEEYKEKKQIKAVANAAGFSFIIVLLCSVLITALSSILMVFLPGADLKSLMKDPAITLVFQILYSLLLFTVPFIIIFKLFGHRISRLVSFRKTDGKTSTALVFFGLAFCSFANIASSYLSSLLSSFGIDVGIDKFELPSGFFGFLISVIAIAIVPALVEEFAFRGIIIGALRKFGDGFAIIISAICFGLIHGNFEQAPFAILVGLYLGFTVAKTNSLRVAVVVHCLNNLSSPLFGYLSKYFSDNTINLIYLLYLLFSLTAGFVFLAITAKDKNFFQLEIDNTVTSLKQRVKSFFSSPAIIVFIVFCCLEAIMLLFV